MADEPQKPQSADAADPADAAAAKTAQPATPPIAAGDKPASAAHGEPLKAEVSRTDSPGAGVSAAPVGETSHEPPAPLPAIPAAASTAVTSETSSATGQLTQPSPADQKPASAGQVAPPSPAAAAKASGAEAAATNPAAPKPAVAKPATPAAAAKPAAAAATAGKPAAPAAAGAAKPAAPAAKAAPHPPAAPAPPSGPTEPPPPADMAVPAFITTLQSTLPGAVILVSYYVGDWTLVVTLEQLTPSLHHLRDAPDAAFDFCSDLTAIDWPPRKEARFDLLYLLYSTRHRHRVRVKVRVGETTPVPSATPIWPAANWLEREVYDMFGVNFTGHPDRRRILMPDDWQGFPQRKDYPLEGPGELLMENPEDWLKLRQSREEADIE